MKKILKLTAVICSALLLAAVCPTASYAEAVITPELMEVMQSGNEELINVTIGRKDNVVDEEKRSCSINETKNYYQEIIYDFSEFSEEKVDEYTKQIADSVNGNPDSYKKIFMDYYAMIEPTLAEINKQNAQEFFQKTEYLIYGLYRKLDNFSKSEYYKESAEKIIAEENLDSSKVSYSTVTTSMSGKLTHDEIIRLSKRDDIISLEYIKPAEPFNADYNREGKISDGIYSAIENNEDNIEIFIIYSIHIINYNQLQEDAKNLAIEYGETLDPEIYSQDEIMNMRAEYQNRIYKKMLEKAYEECVTIVTESLGISPSGVTGRDDEYGSINCILSAKELKKAASLTIENELVRRIGTSAEWKYEIQPVTCPNPTVNTINKGEKVKNGDLNGDTKINIADLVLLQWTLNNDKAYSRAADMNNDGAVDVFDVILLKRIILAV